MGRNKGSSQRTKGNVKPSSSGRSAQLLGSVSTAGFLGFGESCNSLVLPTSPVHEDLDCSLPGAVRMVMNRFAKKDSTTKMKALEDFIELCRTSEDEVLRGLLPYWPRFYLKLSQDPHHRVREMCHKAHLELINKIKRELAPHLRVIMPQWLLSQNDVYAPAASAAQRSFQAAFQAAKQADAVLYCKVESLSLIQENLTTLTCDTQSDPKEDEKEVMARYERVVSSSLLGLKTLLGLTCTSGSVDPFIQDCIEQIVEHPKFWAHYNSKVAIVSCSWLSLVSALCQYTPEVVRHQSKQLVSALLNKLDERDPLLAVGIWECSLCVLLVVPDWVDHIKFNGVLNKLHTILKTGARGNAVRIMPNVAPFLAMLPVSVLGAQPLLFDNLLSSLWEGLQVPSVLSSPIESRAIMRAYFQCLQLYLLKRHQYGDWVGLMKVKIVSLIAKSIEEGCGPPPLKFLYQQLAQLLHKVHKGIENSEAGHVHQSHCREIMTVFWDNLFPVLEHIITATKVGHTQQIDRTAELLHCLSYPFEGSTIETTSKVRFSDSPVKLQVPHQVSPVSKIIPEKLRGQILRKAYTTALYSPSSLTLGFLSKIITDHISNDLLMDMIGRADCVSPGNLFVTDLVMPQLKMGQDCDSLISILAAIYPLLNNKPGILSSLTDVGEFGVLQGLAVQLKELYLDDKDLRAWLVGDAFGSALLQLIISTIAKSERNSQQLTLLQQAIDLLFWSDQEKCPVMKISFINELLLFSTNLLGAIDAASSSAVSIIVCKISSAFFKLKEWWSFSTAARFLASLIVNLDFHSYSNGIECLVIENQWEALWECCGMVGEVHKSRLNTAFDVDLMISKDIDVLNIVYTKSQKNGASDFDLDNQLERTLMLFLPCQAELEEDYIEINSIYKFYRSLFHNEEDGEYPVKSKSLEYLLKKLQFVRGHLFSSISPPIWSVMYCLAAELYTVWCSQLVRVRGAELFLGPGNGNDIQTDVNSANLLETLPKEYHTKLLENAIVQVRKTGQFWPQVVHLIFEKVHADTSCFNNIDLDYFRCSSMGDVVMLMEWRQVEGILLSVASKLLEHSGPNDEVVGCLAVINVILTHKDCGDSHSINTLSSILRKILEWRETHTEFFHFDSPQGELQKSPGVIQVMKFITGSLKISHSDATREDWSGVLCCCYAWCHTVTCWLDDECCLTPLICTFVTCCYEMLVQVANYMQSNPVDDLLHLQETQKEWEEFFSGQLFCVLVDQFLKLLGSSAGPNGEKVYVAYLSAILKFTLQDPSSHFPSLISPSADEYPIKMASQQESAVIHLLPCLLNPSVSVRWSAYHLTLLTLKSMKIVEVPELLEDVLSPHPAFLEIISSAEGVVVTCLADYPVGTFCQVSPLTDSYTYTCAYLLTWLLLLKWIALLPDNVKFLVTEYLREKGHSEALLNSLFKLMSSSVPVILTTDTTPSKEELRIIRQQYLTAVPTVILAAETSDDVVQLAWQTYFKCLTTLPAMVRSWWRSTDKRVNQYVEQVTRDNVSDLVCLLEMEAVLYCGDLPNLLVKTRPTIREVVAVYDLQEAQMELVISLPASYPLGSVKVESGEKVCVGTSQWRTWLLQLSTFLSHQNGSVLSGILLWKKNVDKKFEGVEECYICFYVLHGSNYQLPRLSCSTCKKKFHSACLYKWFSTSHNTTCPLCRNTF